MLFKGDPSGPAAAGDMSRKSGQDTGTRKSAQVQSAAEVSGATRRGQAKGHKKRGRNHGWEMLTFMQKDPVKEPAKEWGWRQRKGVIWEKK